MAPSAKKIQEALLDGTYEVYTNSPDETTVNKVRKHAEEKLGLEEGFFSTGVWKAKSKTIIKERVEKLLDGWVPETKDAPDSKDRSKRRSLEVAPPEPKRQKRVSKPKKPAKKVESDLSELSELDEMSEEDKPKPKKQEKSPASRHESKEVRSKNDAAGAFEDKSPDHKAEVDAEDTSGEGKTTKESNDVDKTEPLKEKTPPVVRRPVITLGEVIEDDEPVPIKSLDSEPTVDEEEEYSDVIDELPKPKRKKKDKKEPSSKVAKPSKTATKKASAPEDPQEAEIKKLQNQLLKCGVRKLWHNELKSCGNNARAKISHLKKMLSDVGMEGRFSEAKAREIKETRELMAEAEAAQEMNKLWGMDNGGRASRSKAKPAEVVQNESGDEEDEDEDNTYAARRKRVHAELAFLGDDSDSD